MMQEEVLYYDTQDLKYGILSSPLQERPDLPLIILLNAGLINRQGPNRVYVTLSRKLNELGFACFRFDLPGIGDSVNNSRFTTKSQMYLHALDAVVRYFRESGRVTSFVLLGLCTGADLAHDYALLETDIAGVCMVNGTRLPKNKNASSRVGDRYYRKYLTDIRRWLKFLSIKKMLKVPRYALLLFLFLLQKLKSLFVGGKKHQENEIKKEDNPNQHTNEQWIRLVSGRTEVLQIISEGSETFDDLASLDSGTQAVNARRKNYRQHVVIDADHTFTSVMSQRDLIAKITTWCCQCFYKGSAANAARHQTELHPFFQK